jgi:hypothetical protein
MENSRRLECLIAKRVLAIKIEALNEDSNIYESSQELDKDSLHPNYKSQVSITPNHKLNKGKCKVPAAIEQFLRNDRSNNMVFEGNGIVSTLSSEEAIDERQQVCGKKKNGTKKIVNVFCSSSCIIG